MQQRQQISRRFAGAGLRKTDQILTGQHGGYRLTLDGCRGQQSCGSGIINDGWSEAELKKRITLKAVCASFGRRVPWFSHKKGSFFCRTQMPTKLTPRGSGISLPEGMTPDAAWWLISMHHHACHQRWGSA